MIEYSPASAVIIDDDLFITLHIPLMDNHYYELFKLYSLGVIQRDFEPPVFAFITPRKSHFARRYDHKNYFLMNEEDLNKCNYLEHRYNCINSQQIFDEGFNELCEIRILSNLSIDSNSCDIRVKQAVLTDWIHLKTHKKWVFSTPNPTTVKIQCQKLVKNITSIANAGLISLEPDCQLRDGNFILKGTDAITQYKWSGVNPNTELNISKLHRNLREHNFDKIFRKLKPHFDPVTNSISLPHLVECIDKESKLHTQNLWIMSVTGACFCLIIVLLCLNLKIFLKHKGKGKRRMQKMKTQPETELRTEPNITVETNGKSTQVLPIPKPRTHMDNTNKPERTQSRGSIQLNAEVA